MVHAESFDDFYEKAVTLYRADPSRIRYVTKYRHCDGYLVFKVTDDTEARSCFFNLLPRSEVRRCGVSRTALVVLFFLKSSTAIRLYFRCISFGSMEASDLKKLEKLNSLFNEHSLFLGV